MKQEPESDELHDKLEECIGDAASLLAHLRGEHKLVPPTQKDGLRREFIQGLQPIVQRMQKGMSQILEFLTSPTTHDPLTLTEETTQQLCQIAAVASVMSDNPQEYLLMLARDKTLQEIFGLSDETIEKLYQGAKFLGGVVRARALAKRLDAPLAIVDKRRERAGESEVMNIIGDVAGRECVLLDDIVDSGGTLCNAADALLDAGAAGVSAYITHGVLSGGAVARIAASKLTELVLTDTIAPTEAVRVARNIRVISIAPLIGEAIGRIAKEESVSSLFN